MDTEVTQEMYTSLLGTNPSYFNESTALGETASTAPVEQITFYQAMQYANLLSETEGLDTCYECSYSMENKIASLSF
mgnify:FL=1